MSNNAPARVRNTDQDPRIARTTHALGRALIELIQEREYDEITVQQILDRAGVGRATFYAHYRNKDDALHSSYEGLFRIMESLLVRSATPGRLFPVAEFVAHLADAEELARALRRSGLADEMWEAAAAHAAAIIERRLASWPPPGSDVPRPLAARMLGAALMEMVRWHVERASRTTSRQLDAAFHAFARGALSRAFTSGAPGA